MLGVGIEWAEEFHLVALGRPGEGVFDTPGSSTPRLRWRASRRRRRPAAWFTRIAAVEPDPAEVRVEFALAGSAGDRGPTGTPPCGPWATAGWRSSGHCLTKGVPYDESIHVANRNRALGRVNQPTTLAAWNGG
jgi:hypothetical protein